MKNPRGYGAASVNAFHATRALPCLSGGLPGGRGKPGEHGAKDGGKSGIFDPGWGTGPARHGMVQRGVAQRGTARRGTARHGMVQRGTAQRGAAWASDPPATLRIPSLANPRLNPGLIPFLPSPPSPAEQLCPWRPGTSTSGMASATFPPRSFRRPRARCVAPLAFGAVQRSNRGLRTPVAGRAGDDLGVCRPMARGFNPRQPSLTAPAPTPTPRLPSPRRKWRCWRRGTCSWVAGAPTSSLGTGTHAPRGRATRRGQTWWPCAWGPASPTWRSRTWRWR